MQSINFISKNRIVDQSSSSLIFELISLCLRIAIEIKLEMNEDDLLKHTSAFCFQPRRRQRLRNALQRLSCQRGKQHFNKVNTIFILIEEEF